MTRDDRGTKSVIATVSWLQILMAMLFYSSSAVNAIMADVRTALKLLLQARVFYIFTILLMLIAAPSVDHAHASATTSIDIVRNQKNAVITLIKD